MAFLEDNDRKKTQVLLDIESLSIVIKSINSNSYDTIYLGDSEFLIMKKLLESDGKVVKRDALVEIGWPDRCVSQSSLNVSIMKLRSKLLEYDSLLKIKTKQSVGYSLHVNGCVHEVMNKKSKSHRDGDNILNLFSYVLTGLIIGLIIGLIF